MGAGGRLGRALKQRYAQDFEIAALGRADLDLAAPATVRTALEGLDYDLLLNCAALTQVDDCETHPEEAYNTNAESVRELGEVSATKKARVIHFSTDFVFDGKKREPYGEDDPAEPLSVYGKSKLKGEQELLAAWEAHLVVRLSWLFGPERPGFPDWVAEKAREVEGLTIVEDRISSPTFTTDVTEALEPLLFGDTAVGGVLHLCNGGACSQRDWAQYCVDGLTKAGVALKTTTVGSCKMADLDSFVAQRPVYSTLSTEKFKSLTGRELPSWKDAMDRYIDATIAPRFRS